MYDFLSDDWMDAAREIREKYQADLPEVTIEVRINQIITEVPFGEGVVNAYVDSSSGSLDLELGELDDPDAVLMVDYETAKAMVVGRDPAIVMQSFMEGRIKVQGDMMKMMAMQTSMPQDDIAKTVAAEIAWSNSR